MRGLPGSGKSHVAKLIRVSEIISNPQFIGSMLRIMLCSHFTKSRTYGSMVAGGYLQHFKDKEVECGGAPPRVLVLDDYFMTEVEKVEKDPDTGRKVKTKVSSNINSNTN